MNTTPLVSIHGVPPCLQIRPTPKSPPKAGNLPHATGDGGKKESFRRVNFDFKGADRGPPISIIAERVLGFVKWGEAGAYKRM